MIGNLRFLVFFLLVTSICEAATFHPISDSHRSAALQLLKPVDGSFGSLEETYEALNTLEILGTGKEIDVTASSCSAVVDTLGSSTSGLKELFYATRSNVLLKCQIDANTFADVASRLKSSVTKASSLLDFYYSIGGLKFIKDQASEVDALLSDGDGIFKSIKALSQSDGRWRYGSNNPASSTYAAGLALETLAGVVSLSTSEIDQSLIGMVNNDIVKLFDVVEKYDDGSYYFDEKLVDAPEYQGPLSATSAVIRGLTAFAAATSGSLHVPGEKILGLAKFFLGVGIPGNAKDLYDQVDALARLEKNRVSVPLILSLPTSVLSLTKKDQLKVRVSTVMGSAAPPLSVKLVQAIRSSSKGGASVIESQELKFDPENNIHLLDALPEGVDVGSYVFVFEILLHDQELKKVYATGGRTKVPIHVTGVITVDNAEIVVLDSDLGSVETKKKLDLAGENALSLSANHLQKLRLSFQLSTPLGHQFKPHQAFLKLTHVSKVEHNFVLENSGKQLEIQLDFLGLFEKFYYLSGKYDIQLTVGDAAMENSFLKELGSIDLDLPEAPEKATRPPPQSVDPYSRYGPKAEITHIFRIPEKRPPQELSYAFLGLVLLPFFGFLFGLVKLGVNLKNFPTATVPATFATLFHVGIGSVLSLYALFWLKLDLFTTLKALGFLGMFLMFVGHRTLSHLASASAKLKSA